MIGDTSLRRLRQVSPSLMNKPSPISGCSMCRMVGLLRSNTALRVLKAYWTVSGVLHTNTRWARILVPMKSYSNAPSAHIPIRFLRAAMMRCQVDGSSANDADRAE